MEEHLSAAVSWKSFAIFLLLLFSLLASLKLSASHLGLAFGAEIRGLAKTGLALRLGLWVCSPEEGSPRRQLRRGTAAAVGPRPSASGVGFSPTAANRATLFCTLSALISRQGNVNFEVTQPNLNCVSGVVSAVPRG